MTLGVEERAVMNALRGAGVIEHAGPGRGWFEVLRERRLIEHVAGVGWMLTGEGLRVLEDVEAGEISRGAERP